MNRTGPRVGRFRTRHGGRIRLLARRKPLTYRSRIRFYPTSPAEWISLTDLEQVLGHIPIDLRRVGRLV